MKAALEIKANPLGLDRPTKYGPKLITRLLRQEGLRHYSATGVYVRDIFVCPKPMFFPFDYGEEFSEDRLDGDTLAAHFWDRSWSKDIPTPIRWVQALRRHIAVQR
jgi:hypothetical protein